MADNGSNIPNLNNFDKPFTFDRVVRIVITLLILWGVFYFIHITSDALLPFMVAWLIAYLLNPLVKWVGRLLHIKNRFISITIVLAAITAFFTVVIIALLPSVKDEFRVLSQATANFFDNRMFIPTLPHELQDYIATHFNIKALIAQLTPEDFSSVTSEVFKVVGGVFKGSFQVVMGTLLVFMVLIYIVFILLDYDRISTDAIKLIPQRFRPQVVNVVSDVEMAMNRYFRGQALVAFIVGILYAIGFSIVGLPMAIVLGLFIGVLNMVPYLQLAGLMPLTLLCLLGSVGGAHSFWPLFLACLGVMLVVQIIEDLFLVPKIMGKITGLNPAIILLSLSVWGIILGVVGMIIALPMTSLLLSYYQHFISEIDKSEEKTVD